MLDMDYEKSRFETKLKKYEEDLDAYIEKAVNYYELLGIYDSKEDIDTSELIWNDENDERGYQLLLKNIWICKKIISTIDAINSAGDDQKAIHRNNKSIETLISSIRSIKHKSEDFINREQEMIKESNDALEFLSFARKK